VRERVDDVAGLAAEDDVCRLFHPGPAPNGHDDRRLDDPGQLLEVSRDAYGDEDAWCNGPAVEADLAVAGKVTPRADLARPSDGDSFGDPARR
jgi:hypothetical protein